jgi:biotin operon repressor
MNYVGPDLGRNPDHQRRIEWLTRYHEANEPKPFVEPKPAPKPVRVVVVEGLGEFASNKLAAEAMGLTRSAVTAAVKRGVPIGSKNGKGYRLRIEWREQHATE